ncbi:MAG: aspartate aminotransferase family protein [bacterium]
MKHTTLEKLESKTPRSRLLHKRALKVMPGGVCHNLRYHEPYPFYAKRTDGAYFWDVDGNKYLDFWMGHYLNILGHNPEVIATSIKKEIEKGIQWGIVHPKQVELAEIVCRLIPSAEQVRFCCSGTEGGINARRLARVYTKKSKFIKMQGGWHGAGAVSAMVDNPALSVSKLGGSSKEAKEETIVVPFNDTQKVADAISKNANDLAGVIMEPVLGEGGFIPADLEFLRTIRQMTEKVGALLIFDEVITGFRLALGGAQSVFNIMPDLTVLGKILGGGMPIGAVAGRADIMKRCSPIEDLPASEKTLIGGGTFSCAPLSMTAGIAMLTYLEENQDWIYPRLNRMGEKIRDQVELIFLRHGLNVQCTGIASLFMTNFPKSKGMKLESCENISLDCDLSRREGDLRLRLLNKGVFAMHGGGALSVRHTEQDLQFFFTVLDEVAQEMALGDHYKEENYAYNLSQYYNEAMLHYK